MGHLNCYALIKALRIITIPTNVFASIASVLMKPWLGLQDRLLLLISDMFNTPMLCKKRTSCERDHGKPYQCLNIDGFDMLFRLNNPAEIDCDPNLSGS
jgi:hypothetical protein